MMRDTGSSKTEAAVSRGNEVRFQSAAIVVGGKTGRAQEEMHLDGRLPEGYVVLCTADSDPHTFLVRRLGLSVECPKCGRTALSADLAAAYYDQMSGRVTRR